MAQGTELPPAGGVRAGKRKPVPVRALAGIAIAAFLICLILLLFLGLSSFSLPWLGDTSDHVRDINASAVARPATENDYIGTWQGYSDDGKNQVITFTSDNRFCHWVTDKTRMSSYNGSWRHDSSLYVYRLIYDTGEYSASVKIRPIADNQTMTMRLEPLSSAAGMPLKGFDLERWN